MLASDPVRLTVKRTIGRLAATQQQQSFRGPDNKATPLDRTREFLALRPGNLERLDAHAIATANEDEIELIEGKLALSRYRSRYQVVLQRIIAMRAEEIYMEGGRHTADVEVGHNLRLEVELTYQVLPVDTKATRGGRPRRTRRLPELPCQVPPSCSIRTPAQGRATAQEGECRKLHSY